MAQTIDLPVIHRGSSLRTALTKMKKHQRSGLVVKKGAHFLLYTVTEIRAGLSDELKLVNDLRPKYKSVTPGSDAPPKRSRAPSLAAYMKKSLARASEKQFLVLNASTSQVTIAVPKRQFLVSLRSAPRNCHCTGPRQHDEFPTRVSTGDDCPHCGKKIDCDD
jgi:hypothetical protein